jgi:hypothetical protein
LYKKEKQELETPGFEKNESGKVEKAITVINPNN